MGKVCSTLLFFFLILNSAQAQKLEFGPSIQKTHDFYWENGFSLQYSFAGIKEGQFYAGAEFLSSRLGTGFNTNALDQDHYILYGAWLSNAEGNWHVSSKLKLAYFRVDLEEEIFSELPNSAFYIAPEVGLAYDVPKLPIRLNLALGYSFDFADGGQSPGSLQPLHYNLRLQYQL